MPAPTLTAADRDALRADIKSLKALIDHALASSHLAHTALRRAQVKLDQYDLNDVVVDAVERDLDQMSHNGLHHTVVELENWQLLAGRALVKLEAPDKAPDET